MTRYLLTIVALLFSAAWNAKAFQQQSVAHHHPFVRTKGGASSVLRPPITELRMSSPTSDEKPSGKNSNLKKRLLSESIAPWRTLRIFLYGSLGSGAFIGGFITLTGTLAALNQQREDFSLNTELLNLGIDFGAVLIFALLARWDIGKGKELEDKVEEKIASKKAQSVATRAAKERIKELEVLKLSIQVSTDGMMNEATVRELQVGARQHMIVVIGPRKAIKDALVGANLQKMDFAMSNVLVVPYDTSTELELQTRPSGGFGELPMFERQPYIARPTGEGWEDYVAGEMKAAVEQGGDSVREEGIAIVVASDGGVIRRGVGTVPWRQMVEQLQETSKS